MYNLCILLLYRTFFPVASKRTVLLKDIPLNKMLAETDAPYLAPIPFRGKENHPAYVKNTIQFISNYLNINFEELCSITTNNFYDLFFHICFFLLCELH